MPRSGAPMPYPELIGSLPEIVVSGTSMVEDLYTRGIESPMGFLFVPNAGAAGSSRFYRINLRSGSYQRLADPMTDAVIAPHAAGSQVAGVGCAMIVDLSRPARQGGGNIDVVLIHPLNVAPWMSVVAYDRTLNTWTHQPASGAGTEWNAGGLGAAALAAQWGTDAAMVHRCTSINAAGDDTTYIVCGNNGIYTYSITIANGDIAALANRAGSGVGVTMSWFPMQNPAVIRSFRGGGSNIIDTLTVGGAWAANAAVPGTETWGVGTETSTLPVDPSVLTGSTSLVANDGRFYFWNPAAGRLDGPIAMFAPTGAPCAGKRLFCSTVGPRQYVFMLKAGTNEIWRMRQNY